MHPKKKQLVLNPFNPADGHNNSVWDRARQCRLYGYDIISAEQLIDAWLTANAHLFQRAIPRAEVLRQIQQAYGYAGTPPASEERGKKEKKERQKESPQFVEFVESAFRDFGVDELKKENPNPWPNDKSPVDYLDLLFTDRARREYQERASGKYTSTPQPVVWVCMGTTLPGMRTFKLSALSATRGQSAHVQFVVPNPMKAETGTTKAGTVGWRTRDNAISELDRLFYVVEFDYDSQGKPVPKDAQARRLWCLNTFTNGRLALVVDSGGKSLQGWFRTHGLPFRDVEVFWKAALALGADPKGSQPEQAFRAPGGTRYPKDPPGAQKPQPVIYFDILAGRSRL